MKALPMPTLSFNESQKYWSEILKMCTSPSKSQGILSEFRRDVKVGDTYFKKGTKGLARPFNPVDIFNNQKRYNRELNDKIMGTPSLMNSYDFFFMRTKEGKEYVSTIHTHVSEFDIRPVDRQLTFEF